MHSFEMLTKLTGNPLWADRCEEVTFNTFPASMTPDQKALHYLTCPNSIAQDRQNHAPGIQNGGTMLSYSPFAGYRCCQHNVSHGWPYYAEELWLATADKGLCASLYAASEVSAKVGSGATVSIAEMTQYPFEETVRFRLRADAPAKFPLYLRVPRWCQRASVELNGKDLAVKAEPLSYLVIDRTWKSGDSVTLELPMDVTVRTWQKNMAAVSVDRGPLAYSLTIGEKWQKYGDNAQWPEWEALPTTPWNYGLVLDAQNPSKSLQVMVKPGAVADQPFTPETAPVQIRTQARKIPAWKTDATGLVGLLQQCPAKSEEAVETVTLIPMGCARLRIAAIPTVSAGPEAHEWVAPPAPPLASWCNPGDSTGALNDGIEPKNSNDQSIPRFTWWDHLGTPEWVQYDYKEKRKVSGVAVYWLDDTGGGGCRVPKSWRLLYRDGNDWKPVAAKGEYGVKRDQYNRVEFEPLTTDGLRVEVQLQTDVSGGILEWKVIP